MIYFLTAGINLFRREKTFLREIIFFYRKISFLRENNFLRKYNLFAVAFFGRHKIMQSKCAFETRAPVNQTGELRTIET